MMSSAIEFVIVWEPAHVGTILTARCQHRVQRAIPCRMCVGQVTIMHNGRTAGMHVNMCSPVVPTVAHNFYGCDYGLVRS